MHKTILLWFLSILFVAFSVMAGTTGKIAGTVRDAQTGEPLIGANVVLKGTGMGAATDMDGYFYIINVPIGEYTVEVSMIGYQTVVHPGVKVYLDQTTKLDFKLRPEAIQGEVIEVVAEQKLTVEKDVTTKKVIIDREEIKSLPVRDFSDLVAIQAGVIRIEGSLKGIPGFEDRGIEEVHVRGGRAAEIGYMVDGMYIENPIYGGRYKGIQLNKFAYEQVDMKTGVFNAEYGDAMSAIFNVVTRSGTDKYEGNINLETSALGFEPDRLREYGRVSGAFGGPVPFTNKHVKFIMSGRRTTRKYNVYEFDDIVFDPSDTLANRWDPRLLDKTGLTWEEFQEQHIQHAHRYDRYKGWKAFGFNRDWDLFAKLTFDLSPSMKLELSNWVVGTEFRTFNTENHWYRFYEDGRNIVRQNADRQAFVWTHMISKNTFYTVRGSRFYQEMNIGCKDPKTGRWLDADEYRRPYPPPDVNNWETKIDEHGRTVYYDPIVKEWIPKDWYDYDLYLSYEFFAQGNDRYHHRSYAQTWEAVADITSQVNKHHQIKTGVSYKQHDLYFNEVQLPWLANPYYDYYKKHPIEGSFYIQDKIEYDYMTINAGIRVDMNNPRSKMWENPYDPDTKLIDSKTTYQISPRLGFSHVITEKSTFTFGYGQFYQFPTYRNVYLNSQQSLEAIRPLVGNALLKSQKVTSYEFGLNTELMEGFLFQIIGWSKEYNNLTSTERVPRFPRSYYVFVNRDYATARGFDLNIRFRKKRFSGMIQYTLSRATANTKDPWESYRREYTVETQPRREFLMGYDRTHDMNLSGAYVIPPHQGFKLFGVRPLANSRIDLIFVATSGAPYTPTHNGIAGPTNSEREPWYIQFNMHFRKNFELMGMKYTFGILVFNLFDRKNALDVFTETGKADDPGNYIRRFINRKIYSSTYWDQPYRFGPRRRVDFTLEVSF